MFSETVREAGSEVSISGGGPNRDCINPPENKTFLVVFTIRALAIYMRGVGRIELNFTAGLINLNR